MVSKNLQFLGDGTTTAHALHRATIESLSRRSTAIAPSKAASHGRLLEIDRMSKRAIGTFHYPPGARASVR